MTVLMGYCIIDLHMEKMHKLQKKNLFKFKIYIGKTSK